MNSYIALLGVEGGNEDQDIGVDIVRRALQAPIEQILINSGLEPRQYLDDLMQSPSGIGFNVKTSEFVDMIPSGIIDPKKVTRVALENAASVASLVLMTDCTIVSN